MADDPDIPKPRAAEAPDDQALLLTYLADRDTPCPGCGYNLRGLKEDACPECSGPVALAITGPAAGGVPPRFALAGG